jgi:hypothetical protein
MLTRKNEILAAALDQTNLWLSKTGPSVVRTCNWNW